jgi:hypothetical protein
MSARVSEEATPTPLSLCFKGERDYLQGGDLYNAVIDVLAQRYVPIRNFHLAFHGFLLTLPDMYLMREENRPLRATDAAADLRFKAGVDAEAMFGWLAPSSRPVDCRMPFDEDKIRRHCTISGQTVSIRRDTRFTAIEVAVSMTKHLHNERLPIHEGRWIFTKIELSRPLDKDAAHHLDITLRDNIHNRLTRSEMAVDGARVGHIYFSLLKK